MIVSDRKQFVFVHNPKAAGTSVRRHLAAYDDSTPPFWNFAINWRLRRRVDKAHIPLEDLERGYPETYDKLRAYWTFAIVRNPYPRAVSSFVEWCKATKRKKKVADVAWARRTFREYVRALDVDRTRMDVTMIHGCPQTMFVMNRGEQICDFVAKLERLNGDLEIVADRLGLAPTSLGERYNVSTLRRGDGPPVDADPRDPFGGVAHWYDCATVRRVERFYAADFEAFGYARAS